ncbi:ABC transporter substrate-binding protein [Lichenicoccus sp.]|uniref:ABC transporter substrate-binding protein n=1 Tax=Lichenicoccus sp. TaxID=2781899 RepID=UPI003D14D53F
MKRLLLLAALGTVWAPAVKAATITVATVNNAQMIVMQKLSPNWEKQTGNHVRWVVLEENTLRQRVTADIATRSGQFDVMTIGSYEAPIWGKLQWLAPLSDLPDRYDYSDIFQPVRDAVSSGGKMYAVPFYAESSMTFYRKDLFDAAHVTMPAQPTYGFIEKAAAALTDRSKQIYGICLRGQPGWGENMAYVSTLVNTFGGRWFNEKWQPQLETPAWHQAVELYKTLLTKYGPPGLASNGHNENQALYGSGHCAIWIDATAAAGYVFDKKTSSVSDQTGFAPSPVGKWSGGTGWFWSWNLAVPASTKNIEAAKSFVAWATSKDYIALVGKEEGWVNLPPGTRKSTYQHPEYIAAAPFAGVTEKAIESANLTRPSEQPVPYTGIQYVAIPQFQAIGTAVGQNMAAVLTGQMTVDGALAKSQSQTRSIMRQAGYRQ